MKRHFVHIYAVVRVKIAVDGCEDHTQAIDAADNLLGERKHELFDRTFFEESDLGEPSRGVRLLYSEADDEAHGYLVDEAGDDDYQNSRDYGPNGLPLPTAPPNTDAERVERALSLLIEARDLVRAADNKRTLARIRSAISSAKGARRIQASRRVRAEIAENLANRIDVGEYLIVERAQ